MATKTRRVPIGSMLAKRMIASRMCFSASMELPPGTDLAPAA